MRCRYFAYALLIFLTLRASAQVVQNGVGSPFSMFAGHNLSAWEQRGNANWHIDNQLVAMDQGHGWLIGRLRLENFIVDMEYFSTDKTEAAFFFRSLDPRFISKSNAYELLLSGRSVDGYGVGSLVGRYRVPILLSTGNRWNKLRVTATQNYISVWVNDRKVVDNFYDASFNEGLFALHVMHGPFMIKTFNVTIPGRW